MKLGNDTIICLLFLVPIFTVTILRSAVVHIFELGKSKTRNKKITKKIQIGERILLLGYVERCEHHIRQAKNLRYTYWFFLIFQLFAVVFWLLSLALSSCLVILQYVLILRVLILDLPTLVLFFMMTKHGKNGGVTWKWEV